MNTYQLGNTIKMTVTFKNYDGDLVDPDVVKFITYDSSFTKLSEVTLDLEQNRISRGVYVYYFTTTREGRITYEWYCLQGSLPSLKRTTIEVKKV